MLQLHGNAARENGDNDVELPSDNLTHPISGPSVMLVSCWWHIATSRLEQKEVLKELLTNKGKHMPGITF